jgi:hypothetical protein
MIMRYDSEYLLNLRVYILPMQGCRGKLVPDLMMSYMGDINMSMISLPTVHPHVAALIPSCYLPS